MKMAVQGFQGPLNEAALAGRHLSGQKGKLLHCTSLHSVDDAHNGAAFRMLQGVIPQPVIMDRHGITLRTTASQDGPDVQQAVTQAIAGLSERKVQFTYTDVLARTVGILPPENGVIERARAGIDEAISREQLIPLDREKGLFTSGIHVLDELSVRALSRDIMKQNRVTVHPEKSVPRTAGYSDAVSVLAQDRPSLAIVSGHIS